MAVPIDLGPVRPRPRAADTLRQALGDPALDVVYWRSATGTWIDELGEQVIESVLGPGRVVTPLEREGDWVAALIHDFRLADDQERLRSASLATMVAIDDERTTAELVAGLRDGQASRARILEAGDRQRRRVERDLHDGAQQRLVGLALTLRLASRRAEGDAALTELLVEAGGELDDALAELRELARGLHPAIVADAGLPAALETLAEHPGIPVELSIDLPGRLPGLVERAAYFFVAEALANANKHAAAGRVAVAASVAEGVLHVTVSDDGRGGAAASSGSGLEGLTDRVAALGGHVVIDSDVGCGTKVTADIPLHTPSAAPHPDYDDILLRIVPAGESAGPYAVGTAGGAVGPRGDEDRRLRALKWTAWNTHEAPGEIVELQPEAEDVLHAKALLLCSGGNLGISESRRNWIVGYLTSAGHPENVIEAVRSYADDDRMEDIMSAPRMAMAARSILYDALRACASDRTNPTPADFDPVLRAADAIGISREVVADLQQIVMEEHALRRRRHQIVVAPMIPKAMYDKVGRAPSKPS